MRVVVLGCGTSTGVPTIGCECPTCLSPHPRNKRTRASIYIEEGKAGILVDASTDLRAQALAQGIRRVDAVLFTHCHADHVFGIDDLRAFNAIQRSPIPCYGSPETIAELRVCFRYIFSSEHGEDVFVPRLTLHELKGLERLFGLEVVPVEIEHGPDIIYGYRAGNFAYLTDCSAIPKASERLLRGLRVLIIDGLRYRPHPTHFTIEEALAAAERLKPERTCLTHMSHEVEYEAGNRALPPGVELAWDGLVIEI